MRTVYRGRAHAIFLKVFKCSVIKIINCCQGSRGRSRPLRGRTAGRGTRPTRHRSAQPPARTPTWASRRRALLMAPGSLRRGPVKLSKNKCTRRVFRPSLHLLQRALYPTIRKESRHHLRAAQNCAATPSGCGVSAATILVESTIRRPSQVGLSCGRETNVLRAAGELRVSPKIPEIQVQFHRPNQILDVPFATC